MHLPTGFIGRPGVNLSLSCQGGELFKKHISQAQVRSLSHMTGQRFIREVAGELGGRAFAQAPFTVCAAFSHFPQELMEEQTL